uniref:Amino acid/amide ABC transporter membrane protein 2, HAAT family n=1 Tax=Candidatus Kentrum sp. FW TaxID=2126338 RepID=A0A450TTF3_9GAMM|nr:MAG: amino acid/amide ABC transporter membrane protein 2, HAAT family [Candidatus Kentron sp. FW]
MSRDPLQTPLALVLILLALFAWWQADFFGHELLAEIAIFAIFAMGLDLIFGYTGMVSLGHAAFLAVGAYVTAAMNVFLGWSALPAMGIAVLVSVMVAILVGFLVVRLTGIFFIMVTLAVGQMFHAYFFKSHLFGGDDGMSGIIRPDLGFIGLDANDPMVFSAMMSIGALGVYFLLRTIVRSPFGHMLMAIHHNENRVRALGCPVHRYKLAAYVVAGAIGGLAGSLTAQHTGFISPDLAFWTVSGEVLIIVIVGGMGSLSGAILGSALVILMRHQLSDEATWQLLGLPGAMSSYWQFVMGIFFVLVVLFASDGLYGRLTRLLQMARARLGKSPSGVRP